MLDTAGPGFDHVDVIVRVEGLGLMLVELSVVEQRYHAVMEVLAGIPVVEVAARYRVP